MITIEIKVNHPKGNRIVQDSPRLATLPSPPTWDILTGRIFVLYSCMYKDRNKEISYLQGAHIIGDRSRPVMYVQISSVRMLTNSNDCNMYRYGG
jgi:hypothetical protein